MLTLSAHPSQCTSALAPSFFPVAAKTESAETLAGPADSGQLDYLDFDGADLAEYNYENDGCAHLFRSLLIPFKQWVVVSAPGTDDESICAEFRVFKDAISYLRDNDYVFSEFDVMKRLPDGTLTTEF